MEKIKEDQESDTMGQLGMQEVLKDVAWEGTSAHGMLGSHIEVWVTWKICTCVMAHEYV